MSDYRVVLTTASNMDEAKSIAKEIVKERLAACVNIVPLVESVYVWEDKICEDSEVLLIIKSTKYNIKELKKSIKKLHSYEVPEFIALKIEEGSKDYLDWIEKVVKN